MSLNDTQIQRLQNLFYDESWGLNIKIMFALGHASFVESFNKTMKNKMMKYMK
jgi:hypothetical protein